MTARDGFTSDEVHDRVEASPRPRNRAPTPREVLIADGPKLERLRRLVQILDESIRLPGTNFKFGLDAIIGLFPGGGDVIGALMSGVIIHAAARAGAPRSVILAMLTNGAVDMIVGAIPFLGDAFDFGFKANRRNLDLLERHIAQPEEAKAASRSFIALAVGTTVMVVTGFIILVVLALVFIQKALS